MDIFPPNSLVCDETIAICRNMCNLYLLFDRFFDSDCSPCWDVSFKLKVPPFLLESRRFKGLG
jgi:hypothetical protein